MITKEYLQQELAKRIDGYKRGIETSTDNIIAEMKSILVLVNALPDYEKKYNEALERAKEIKGKILQSHLSTESCKAISEYIDTIIPELNESEDEKIRKALIEALTVSNTIGELKFRLPEPTRKECIAWLEKQKEYHIPWYDYQKSKEAGYTIVPNEEYEQLIKQKEQNPAWSEEDEKMRNLAIEWAETMYGQFRFVDMDSTDFRKIVAWLKSLRPSWKPSEDQMDALKELIDDANKAGWVTPGATELYEQLKKL